MQTGAITGYIDVAQLVLYAFWIFFAGLIYYLHRENKREGYPLESDRSHAIKVQGWPAVPSPKTYKLANGETVQAPNARRDSQPPVHEGAYRGSPFQPEGDPLLAGVGPGSWANRADVPDMTYEGLPRIVPLRTASGFGVAPQDVDPRGLPVQGDDGVEGGRVVDLWVDRSEMLFRYLELKVADGRHVLLPMNFARVLHHRIVVKSILGEQFIRVPGTRHAEQVTLLEEEKIMAYYGAGTLYATPQRQEPLL
ncbi:photosynthetic reaction center subunit H [Roseateles amylovorans]|uniref:Photosynthetic reaction center subunit H n=1 Tax=Roseateles amylovorans TaxID=2978473 RepID=A0ABY6B4T3_9BURK|nr:photosynthetic reaction center subunit H [Roseateles amylovorans]UXH78558.1 photosynthetic reaction center subunit H [Roseateles amylovorans]